MDISNYLSQVAQSGIMGVFNVIFMVTIYVLWRDGSNKALQVNQEKDKRLADAVSVREAADKKDEATRRTLEALVSKMDGFFTQK